MVFFKYVKGEDRLILQLQKYKITVKYVIFRGLFISFCGKMISDGGDVFSVVSVCLMLQQLFRQR